MWKQDTGIIQADRNGNAFSQMLIEGGKILKVIVTKGNTKEGGRFFLRDDYEKYLDVRLVGKNVEVFYPKVPTFYRKQEPIDSPQIFQQPIVLGNLYLEFQQIGKDSVIPNVVIIFE